MIEETLETYLSSRNMFAVIWNGHFGSSFHVFKMNDVAEWRHAKAGGVYGAIYESFYDLTEGLVPVMMINGSYDWKEDDWFDELKKEMNKHGNA